MAKSTDNAEVSVDERGFVYKDGVKLPCKVLPGGVLQFCDKDRKRSKRRGSRFVEVQPQELAEVDKVKITH